MRKRFWARQVCTEKEGCKLLNASRIMSATKRLHSWTCYMLWKGRWFWNKAIFKQNAEISL